MDAAQQILSQYDIRVGQVYLNPTYQTTVPQGQFGTPYKAVHWGMHTTQNFYGSAPFYGWKMNMLYPSKRIPNTNVQGQGQAPTSGIYTGVASCNPNGTYGGM